LHVNVCPGSDSLGCLFSGDHAPTTMCGSAQNNRNGFKNRIRGPNHDDSIQEMG
jgi:hypothetical protein